tara:strand:+ start:379 stop:588 length:210 start_codon:yes stop_codon:yes gene_type:complete
MTFGGRESQEYCFCRNDNDTDLDINILETNLGSDIHNILNINVGGQLRERLKERKKRVELHVRIKLIYI